MRVDAVAAAAMAHAAQESRLDGPSHLHTAAAAAAAAPPTRTQRPLRSVFLTLVRHGQSLDNLAGVWAGHKDAPLSSLGTAQADALARSMAHTRLDAIYSSDLKRASQTAMRLLDHNRTVPPPPLVQTQSLREQHFGQAEGRKYEEAQLSNPSVCASDASPEEQKAARMGKFPEGESLEQVNQRLATAVRRFILPRLEALRGQPGRGYEVKHDGAREDAHVCIVAHGIAIAELLRVFLSYHDTGSAFGEPWSDPRLSYQREKLENTGWTRLQLSVPSQEATEGCFVGTENNVSASAAIESPNKGAAFPLAADAIAAAEANVRPARQDVFVRIVGQQNHTEHLANLVVATPRPSTGGSSSISGSQQQRGAAGVAAADFVAGGSGAVATGSNANRSYPARTDPPAAPTPSKFSQYSANFMSKAMGLGSSGTAARSATAGAPMQASGSNHSQLPAMPLVGLDGNRGPRDVNVTVQPSEEPSPAATMMGSAGDIGASRQQHARRGPLFPAPVIGQPTPGSSSESWQSISMRILPLFDAPSRRVTAASAVAAAAGVGGAGSSGGVATSTSNTGPGSLGNILPPLPGASSVTSPAAHTRPVLAAAATAGSLSISVEELNDAVSAHVKRTLDRGPARASAALSADLHGLLVLGMNRIMSSAAAGRLLLDGMSSPSNSGSTAAKDEGRVLARLADVWVTFFSTVLPWVEAAFLPLGTDPVLLSLASGAAAAAAAAAANAQAATASSSSNNSSSNVNSSSNSSSATSVPTLGGLAANSNAGTATPLSSVATPTGSSQVASPLFSPSSQAPAPALSVVPARPGGGGSSLGSLLQPYPLGAAGPSGAVANAGSQQLPSLSPVGQSSLSPPPMSTTMAATGAQSQGPSPQTASSATNIGGGAPSPSLSLRSQRIEVRKLAFACFRDVVVLPHYEAFFDLFNRAATLEHAYEGGAPGVGDVLSPMGSASAFAAEQQQQPPMVVQSKGEGAGGTTTSALTQMTLLLRSVQSGDDAQRAIDALMRALRVGATLTANGGAGANGNVGVFRYYDDGKGTHAQQGTRGYALQHHGLGGSSPRTGVGTSLGGAAEGSVRGDGKMRMHPSPAGRNADLSYADGATEPGNASARTRERDLPMLGRGATEVAAGPSARRRTPRAGESDEHVDDELDEDHDDDDDDGDDADDEGRRSGLGLNLSTADTAASALAAGPSAGGLSGYMVGGSSTSTLAPSFSSAMTAASSLRELHHHHHHHQNPRHGWVPPPRNPARRQGAPSSAPQTSSRSGSGSGSGSASDMQSLATAPSIPSSPPTQAQAAAGSLPEYRDDEGDGDVDGGANASDANGEARTANSSSQPAMVPAAVEGRPRAATSPEDGPAARSHDLSQQRTPRYDGGESDRGPAAGDPAHPAATVMTGHSPPLSAPASTSAST